MSKLQFNLISAVLSGLALGSVSLTGCAVHAGFYDADHRDYHRWSGSEQPHYDAWVTETHHAHINYDKLNDHDKQSYWDWRHDHR